ncbi:probable glutathione S-transferase [Impatiens glandulifera]|uniref:probable glutathione S-transferase n=1 Tax=Impatiens glandulifera TaxID=253017 RepID=UPI001FB12B63|nr:probable glutathione S-transferase [Impatiens glandulifera]
MAGEADHEEAEVKLIGIWGSPFVKRVKIALQMKGIKYEDIEEPDVYGIKSPLLLQYNPVHKKVPVLIHRGKPIVESLVILEYIDETWNESPILPSDPYQRSLARFWAKYLDEKLIPAIWKSCWSKGKEQEEKMEECFVILKTLEDELNGNKFFGGETIGLVDIAANLLTVWLDVLEQIAGINLLTVDRFPILCRWRDDYVNCTVIKDNLPSREMLLAFFSGQLQATPPPTTT